MSKVLSKDELTRANLGGTSMVYTNRIEKNGDYANVCFFYSFNKTMIEDGDKILIEMLPDFDSKENLEHVKDYFRSVNITASFANDMPGGLFIGADKVVNEIEKAHQLSSSDIGLILREANRSLLHRLYISALKTELSPDSEKELHDGEVSAISSMGFGLYPARKVFNALREIIRQELESNNVNKMTAGSP